MHKLSRLWILCLAFIVVGCKVGPNYHRPCISVPDHWIYEVEGDPMWANVEWWRQFNDPVLVELIEISLQGNKDLKIAAARVNEFAGLYKSTYGELFPFIGGDGIAGRELVSEKITPIGPGIKNPDNFYRLLLTGTWELDLWGKLRRATEAARADLLSSEQARRSVIQTLVSAVAIAYIDLLRLDRQLEISMHTADTREATLELFKKRYAAGVISKIDLSQIESEYQDAMARIPEFRKFIALQENAISVLLGRNPTKIPRGGKIDELNYPKIPSGLPSDLLFQRPDILEAEQNLIAANARIGVARAQYFPTVSLTGVYGTASRDYKDLFKGDARTWNYFVPATVPIFTAGRIAGEVQATEAVRSQTLGVYQLTIIEAFREVEDSLVDITQTWEQLEAQRKQVASLKVYSDLAKLRYDEGYTSYLEVLDAERSLFAIELDYTETYGSYFFSIINLYKSLGGGWIDDADQQSRSKFQSLN